MESPQGSPNRHTRPRSQTFDDVFLHCKPSLSPRQKIGEKSKLTAGAHTRRHEVRSELVSLG